MYASEDLAKRNACDTVIIAVCYYSCVQIIQNILSRQWSYCSIIVLCVALLKGLEPRWLACSPADLVVMDSFSREGGGVA